MVSMSSPHKRGLQDFFTEQCHQCEYSSVCISLLNIQHRQKVLDGIKIKYSLIKRRAELQADKLEAEL